MRGLGRPTKLLIGPWSHTRHTNPIGELNFGFGSQISFINLQEDFGRLQQSTTTDEELFNGMTKRYPDWESNQSWLMFGVPSFPNPAED